MPATCQARLTKEHSTLVGWMLMIRDIPAPILSSGSLALLMISILDLHGHQSIIILRTSF